MTIQVKELPHYLEDYIEEMQIKGLTNKTLKTMNLPYLHSSNTLKPRKRTF